MEAHTEASPVISPAAVVGTAVTVTVEVVVAVPFGPVTVNVMVFVPEVVHETVCGPAAVLPEIEAPVPKSQTYEVVLPVDVFVNTVVIPVHTLCLLMVKEATGAAGGGVLATSSEETANKNQASCGSHCSIHLQFCQSSEA